MNSVRDNESAHVSLLHRHTRTHTDTHGHTHTHTHTHTSGRNCVVSNTFASASRLALRVAAAARAIVVPVLRWTRHHAHAAERSVCARSAREPKHFSACNAAGTATRLVTRLALAWRACKVKSDVAVSTVPARAPLFAHALPRAHIARGVDAPSEVAVALSAPTKGVEAEAVCARRTCVARAPGCKLLAGTLSRLGVARRGCGAVCVAFARNARVCEGRGGAKVVFDTAVAAHAKLHCWKRARRGGENE